MDNSNTQSIESAAEYYRVHNQTPHRRTGCPMCQLKVRLVSKLRSALQDNSVMSGIVEALIGEDLGCRDFKGGKVVSISITLDASMLVTTADGRSHFIGAEPDFQNKLAQIANDATLNARERGLFSLACGTTFNEWTKIMNSPQAQLSFRDGVPQIVMPLQGSD